MFGLFWRGLQIPATNAASVSRIWSRCDDTLRSYEALLLIVMATVEPAAEEAAASTFVSIWFQLTATFTDTNVKTQH